MHRGVACSPRRTRPLPKSCCKPALYLVLCGKTKVICLTLVLHVSTPPPFGHAGSVTDHDTYSSPGTPKGLHTKQTTLTHTVWKNSHGEIYTRVMKCRDGTRELPAVKLGSELCWKP